MESPPERGGQFYVLASAVETSLKSMGLSTPPPSPVKKPGTGFPESDLSPKRKLSALDRKDLLGKLASSGEELIKSALVFGVIWQKLMEYDKEYVPEFEDETNSEEEGKKIDNDDDGGGSDEENDGDDDEHRKLKVEKKKFHERVEKINSEWDGKLSAFSRGTVENKDRMEKFSTMHEAYREKALKAASSASPFETDRVKRETKKFGRLDSAASKIVYGIQPTVCWLAKLLADQTKLTEFVVAQNERIKGWPLSVIPFATGGDLASDSQDYVEVKVTVIQPTKRRPTSNFSWRTAPPDALAFTDERGYPSSIGRETVYPGLSYHREKLMRSIYEKTGGRRGGFVPVIIYPNSKLARSYRLSGFFVYCFFRFFYHRDFASAPSQFRQRPKGQVPAFVQFGEAMCQKCKSFHKLDHCLWFDYALRCLMHEAGLYDVESESYKFGSLEYFEKNAKKTIYLNEMTDFFGNRVDSSSFFRLPDERRSGSGWYDLYDRNDWTLRKSPPSNRNCIRPWLTSDERERLRTANDPSGRKKERFESKIYEKRRKTLDAIIEKDRKNYVPSEETVSSAFSSMGLVDFDFASFLNSVYAKSSAKSRLESLRESDLTEIEKEEEKESTKTTTTTTTGTVGTDDVDEKNASRTTSIPEPKIKSKKKLTFMELKEEKDEGKTKFEGIEDEKSQKEEEEEEGREKEEEKEEKEEEKTSASPKSKKPKKRARKQKKKLHTKLAPISPFDAIVPDETTQKIKLFNEFEERLKTLEILKKDYQTQLKSAVSIEDEIKSKIEVWANADIEKAKRERKTAEPSSEVRNLIGMLASVQLTIGGYVDQLEKTEKKINEVRVSYEKREKSNDETLKQRSLEMEENLKKANEARDELIEEEEREKRKVNKGATGRGRGRGRGKSINFEMIEFQ